MEHKSIKDHAKVLLTISLYLAFTVLGLTSGLIGPSLVHLTYLYHTSITLMSLTYSFFAIGYLLGSVLCAVVFDRINHELQFFLACLQVGILFIIGPWMPHLYLFFACTLLLNVGKGFIDAAGQSYIIGLWQGHKWKDPVTQGAHGLWNVGSFMGPLIVSPFLVDLPKTEVLTETYNYSTTSLTYNVTKYINYSHEIEGIGQVRYPFAIVGSVFCFVSATFLVGFLLTRKFSMRTRRTEHKSKKNSLPGDASSFKVPMIIMVFVFFFFLCYETIPGKMLSALVIKGLEWPVHDGPRLTSLYWASHGIGSLVGIPVSMWLSSTKRLIINITLSTAGFTLMLFAHSIADIVLWISVFIAGFGVSTTFVSAVLWTSSYITITGAVGSVFLIAGSAGSVISGPLVGYLFDNVSYMWVIYLSFLFCCVHIVLFPVMYIFTVVNQKHGGVSVETQPREYVEVKESTHNSLQNDESLEDN